MATPQFPCGIIYPLADGFADFRRPQRLLCVKENGPALLSMPGRFF